MKSTVFSFNFLEERPTEDKEQEYIEYLQPLLHHPELNESAADFKDDQQKVQDGVTEVEADDEEELSPEEQAARKAEKERLE